MLLTIAPGLICRRRYHAGKKKYIVVLEWSASRRLWKVRSWNSRKKVPAGTITYVSPETFWDLYTEVGCRMPQVGDIIQSLSSHPPTEECETATEEGETAILREVEAVSSGAGKMLTIVFSKCVLGTGTELTEAKRFRMKLSLSTYWQAFYTLDTKEEKKKGKKP